MIWRWFKHLFRHEREGYETCVFPRCPYCEERA